MHELSITEGILKTALDKATLHKANKIINISICVGALSGIVPECVQEYFDMLSEDTIAAGAKLKFTTIPARVHCSECNYDFSYERMSLRCPKCKGVHTAICKGKELYIENMEIEES